MNSTPTVVAKPNFSTLGTKEATIEGGTEVKLNNRLVHYGLPGKDIPGGCRKKLRPEVNDARQNESVVFARQLRHAMLQNCDGTSTTVGNLVADEARKPHC